MLRGLSSGESQGVPAQAAPPGEGQHCVNRLRLLDVDAELPCQVAAMVRETPVP
jgi:hypothetical protein